MEAGRKMTRDQHRRGGKGRCGTRGTLRTKGIRVVSTCATLVRSAGERRRTEVTGVRSGRKGKACVVCSLSTPERPSSASASSTAPSSASSSCRVVNVDLGESRSYPIYIGRKLHADAAMYARHIPSRDVLVVSNTTVFPMYAETVMDAITRAGKRVVSVVLPDGEEFKSIENCAPIWETALREKMGRSTTMVALGGGVIGDMVGFASAVYQRGCNFVQIPTTLMAMVDSSVGGKTGVNHALGKNMIGSFHQPKCVIADMDALKTLPERELKAGIAEVIKYGLIRDADFFRWQEGVMEDMVRGDASVLAEAVDRSCVNKAEVVALDEEERGVRATLNLGHTFGHAIENGCGYGEHLHGEAVAMGTGMAADLSERLGWITAETRSRIEALMLRAGLEIAPPESAKIGVEKFLELMAVDKKNVDGKLRLVLLRGEIGGCVVTEDFEWEKLIETLNKYNS